MSQSSEPENWAQFFLFPLMSAARKMKMRWEKWHDIKRCNDSNIENSYWAHMSPVSVLWSLSEWISEHLSSLKITRLSSGLICSFRWVELQFELLHLFCASVCALVYPVAGRGSWEWRSRPLQPPFQLPPQNELHYCRHEADQCTPRPGWSSPRDMKTVVFTLFTWNELYKTECSHRKVRK